MKVKETVYIPAMKSTVIKRNSTHQAKYNELNEL